MCFGELLLMRTLCDAYHKERASILDISVGLALRCSKFLKKLLQKFKKLLLSRTFLKIYTNFPLKVKYHLYAISLQRKYLNNIFRPKLFELQGFLSLTEIVMIPMTSCLLAGFNFNGERAESSNFFETS